MSAVLVGALVEGRGQRAVALVVLALLVGALWWLAGRPIRRPRAIGRPNTDGDATPGPAVRGIGRFARERTGRPPRV